MATSSRPSTDNEPRHEEAFEHISVPAILTQYSLSRAVYDRRAEYIRPHTIKIKVGSWNVAACKDVEKDLGSWFVDGNGTDKKPKKPNTLDDAEECQIQAGNEGIKGQQEMQTNKPSAVPLNEEGDVIGREHIDLYVLGLQEAVELTSAKEYITRVYTDPSTLLKWKKAMMAVLPAGYQLVSEQQLSGLLLLIFASPHLAPTVGSVSSVCVGTGILGYLGNKGAIVTRIVLGETTRLVFVNCHLASGSGPTHLGRRCWDFTQILTRTHFDPIIRAGILDDNQEGIGEEDFAFWFGDLNFRLEGLPGEDIRRLLMLHTRGEYGNDDDIQRNIDPEVGKIDEPVVVHHIDSDDESTIPFPPPTGQSASNKDDEVFWSALPDPDEFVQDPHSDPASLQAIIDSLLPHDELLYVQKKRLAFHDGWREGPITFLPTYKYDVGSVGLFDSSEKKRAPSWCDRILYRTKCDKHEYDKKVQEEDLAKLKDQEMKARGIDHVGDDEVLFDYDPESDGADVDPNADYAENEDGAADPQAVDRKEGSVNSLHLDIYTSHQQIISSDHKPLDAVFTLCYDAAVSELKSKVQHEVARELDRAENEARPGITVVVDHTQEVDDISLPKSAVRRTPSIGEAPPLEGTEGVDFGDVRYLTRKSRSLTIANTGRVPATFSFVKRPSSSGGNGSICPEWLDVTFSPSDDNEYGQAVENPEIDVTLLPGDAVNVTIDIFVENLAHVRALNNGLMQLDDILVLRVLDGRDHFIPVKGSWLQSCFGRSIDELIRVPEGGVRALPPHYALDSASVNRGRDVRWSVPRELFKLTEAVEILAERAIADKGMVENADFPMNSPGWPFEQSSWIVGDRKVREERRSHLLEALDSDKILIEPSQPDASARIKLEIVAEVLLLFLGSMEDGIITTHLWDKLEHDIAGRKQPLGPEEERAWILDVLSSAPNHNIAFVFLTSMLLKIASELTPLPRPGPTHGAGSAKSSMDHRRPLSFKGRSAAVSQDPMISRRKTTARRWSDIFAGVVFRASPVVRERDRRVAEDRKRQMIEVFLLGDIENT